MGDGVVRCRLRVRRCEMLEGRSGARAENVAAFVIFKHDHDDMRDPRNIRRGSGAPRTRNDDHARRGQRPLQKRPARSHDNGSLRQTRRQLTAPRDSSRSTGRVRKSVARSRRRVTPQCSGRIGACRRPGQALTRSPASHVRLVRTLAPMVRVSHEESVNPAGEQMASREDALAQGVFLAPGSPSYSGPCLARLSRLATARTRPCVESSRLRPSRRPLR